MTNKKNTKKALLMSMLSLLLCFSMLIGTTFAWFTDVVESGKNQIVAGNLDVALEYSKDMSDGSWKSVEGQTDLVDPLALWEPGHTEVVYLKISNEGTLALKYSFSISFEDLVIGKNEKGEDIKLSEHLKYAVVDVTEKFASRDAARKAVADVAVDLAGYSVNGKMNAGDPAKTVALVVYMPESVGNEANYRGEKIPQIELGVNLFATQMTEEEDSFDETYDKYTAVFTVADANAMLAENKDVTLVNCVEPNGVLEIPGNYTGKLVLNNVSIASVQVVSATTFSTTPAAVETIEIVILGDVVVKATEDGQSAISGPALDISGSGTLTAVAKGDHAYGIGATGATVKISNINIDYVAGGHAYGVGTDTKYYKDAPEGAPAIGGSVVTLEKVTINKAVGGSKAAGIGAMYHNGVTVTITDSTIGYVEGGVSAAGIGSSRVSGGATESGATINITNSTITAVGGAYGAGIGSGYDTHCQAKQPLCTINIEDSVINATGGKYAAGVGTGYHNAALAGEIKNSTVTAVSGDKVYKAKYTAAMDIGFGVTDPTREGQQTDSKLIYNGVEITLANAPDVVEPSEDLKSLIQNNTTIVLVGGEYKLPTLSGKEGVTIIGAADGSTVIGGENTVTGFGGNFGKGTTIKNVTFTGSDDGVWYSYANGGTTVFENCVFAGERVYGFHIDQSNSATFIFNNCTFSGFNAFAGDLEKVIFNNCTFLHNGNYGHTNIWSVGEFNNCTWGDKTSVSPARSSAKLFFDGVEESYHHEFIGSAESLFDFADSVNNGNDPWAGQKIILVADIDLEKAAWTPIGQTGATQFQGTFDGHGYTIKNLNIDSSKQTGANYSSGLFGWLNHATVKNLTIENATVTGNHNVGVIAGYMETAGCTISNCHVINATVTANHANDDACGDKVGVIVGHAGNAGVKVENCSATDCTVTAGRDAGQIVGAAKEENVTGCTATNVTVGATGTCTGANIREEIIGRVL